MAAQDPLTPVLSPRGERGPRCGPLPGEKEIQASPRPNGERDRVRGSFATMRSIAETSPFSISAGSRLCPGGRDRAGQQGQEHDDAEMVVAAETVEAVLRVVDIERRHLPDEVCGSHGEPCVEPWPLAYGESRESQCADGDAEEQAEPCGVLLPKRSAVDLMPARMSSSLSWCA